MKFWYFWYRFAAILSDVFALIFSFKIVPLFFSVFSNNGHPVWVLCVVPFQNGKTFPPNSKWSYRFVIEATYSVFLLECMLCKYVYCSINWKASIIYTKHFRHLTVTLQSTGCIVHRDLLKVGGAIQVIAYMDECELSFHGTFQTFGWFLAFNFLKLRQSDIGWCCTLVEGWIMWRVFDVYYIPRFI